MENLIGDDLDRLPELAREADTRGAAVLVEELLAEGIHLCKINKEAELSAQATMPFYPQCERRATVMRSECVRRFRCKPQEAYL